MPGHDGPIAVAVSGGGDSLALMHLLAGYARTHGLAAPIVLTVDHGLRPDSARDARRVAGWARKAGLKAHILSWTDAKPARGVEAAAREARYRLMGGWLARKKIATLFVGHTLDDQAETFLLRLARGSGLDGLSAMQAHAPWPVPGFGSLSVRRPLLGVGRGELRRYLTAIGQEWLDDPMNDDPAFDRVKMRRAAAALDAAGLSAARIAAAAAHLARARGALEAVTQAVLARATHVLEDGLALDAAALAAVPREVGLRALAAMLMAVGGQAYRPRFEALERLFEVIVTDRLKGGATLHGCRIAPAPRAGRHFGTGTLLVTAEKSRKKSSKNNGATSARTARRHRRAVAGQP